jgi:hypothetical protein
MNGGENTVTSFMLTKNDFAATHLDTNGDASTNNSRGQKRIWLWSFRVREDANWLPLMASVWPKVAAEINALKSIDCVWQYTACYKKVYTDVYSRSHCLPTKNSEVCLNYLTLPKSSHSVGLMTLQILSYVAILNGRQTQTCFSRGSPYIIKCLFRFLLVGNPQLLNQCNDKNTIWKIRGSNSGRCKILLTCLKHFERLCCPQVEVRI